MREMVLAMSAKNLNPSTASSVTNITSSFGSGPAVFILSLLLPVFNLSPPSHRVLPVPIQAAFPHIKLQLNLSLGCGNCPTIRRVVNTAAALSTGNLHFFSAIAKVYPHLVTSILTAQRTTPQFHSVASSSKGVPLSLGTSQLGFSFVYLT
jgi:hypothetical protein